MKTLGLIGGMSWESTAIYYRLINEMIRQQLGGLHSAKILLWSFDFDEIAALQSAGRWDDAAGLLAEAGRALESGGADALVLCTNTMHKLADEVQASVSVPLLHIADDRHPGLPEQAGRDGRGDETPGGFKAGAAGDTLHHGTALLHGQAPRSARDRSDRSGRCRSRCRTPHHL